MVELTRRHLVFSGASLAAIGALSVKAEAEVDDPPRGILRRSVFGHVLDKNARVLKQIRELPDVRLLSPTYREFVYDAHRTVSEEIEGIGCLAALGYYKANEVPNGNIAAITQALQQLKGTPFTDDDAEYITASTQRLMNESIGHEDEVIAGATAAGGWENYVGVVSSSLLDFSLDGDRGPGKPQLSFRHSLGPAKNNLQAPDGRSIPGPAACWYLSQGYWYTGFALRALMTNPLQIITVSGIAGGSAIGAGALSAAVIGPEVALGIATAWLVGGLVLKAVC